MGMCITILWMSSLAIHHLLLGNRLLLAHIAATFGEAVENKMTGRINICIYAWLIQIFFVP